MKRGLKVSKTELTIFQRSCYNRFPDEKGTESKIDPDGYPRAVSYNRFPDEKGTESLPDIADSTEIPGYNRFPDEKGTERWSTTHTHNSFESVTTVSPMKRGLKGEARADYEFEGILLQPFPR